MNNLLIFVKTCGEPINYHEQAFYKSFIWLHQNLWRVSSILKIIMLLQKKYHPIVTCLFLLNWMVIISFKSDHHDQRLRGENPLKLLRNLKQDHTCGSYTLHTQKKTSLLPPNINYFGSLSSWRNGRDSDT